MEKLEAMCFTESVENKKRQQENKRKEEAAAIAARQNADQPEEKKAGEQGDDMPSPRGSVHDDDEGEEMNDADAE